MASAHALELMLEFFARERGLRDIQKLRCLTRRALFFECVGNQLFFLLVHDLVEIKTFFAAHLALERRNDLGTDSTARPAKL